MLVNSYNCYNDKAEGNINPINSLKRIFRTTEIVLKKLKELQPDVFDDYITIFSEKLNDHAKPKKFDSDQFDLEKLTNKLELLQIHPELQKIIFNFVYHSLEVPEGYNPEQGEILLFYSNEFKTRERLSYHRVKSIIDLLGKNQAVELYKKIVPELIVDMNKDINIDKTKDPADFSVIERRDQAIESWCRIGLVDFTVATFDKYKVLYRFDKCGVHEALKDFADPDVAYLCSCYLGDAEEFNDGKIIHMRRTQTLHHGKFCDELYWNNEIYIDTKQPTLAFTESLIEK